MSTPPSETSTLREGLEDRDLDQDVPIHVDSFLRHVRRWKGAVGAALAISLGTEIWAVVEGVDIIMVRGKAGKLAVAAERIGDLAGLVMMVRTESGRAKLTPVILYRFVCGVAVQAHQKVADPWSASE